MSPEIASGARRRIIVVLFTVSSLAAAAQVAYFTLMPIIAADLSGSDAAAGVPSTLGLVFRALTTYPLGWLMGRAGRRLGLSLGLFVGMLGTAVSAWAIGVGHFWIFAVGAGVAGVARGAADLSRYAAAEVSPPERRAKIIGWIVFAGTIGALMGPFLVAPAAGLAGRMGLVYESGPFWAATVVLFLAIILTYVFVRPDPLLISRHMAMARHQEFGEQPEAPSRPVRQLMKSWHVRLGMISMAIGQLVMTMIMVITPLHMSHSGHSIDSISFVILAHQLGMFGLSSVTGGLVDRFGPAAVIIGGSAVLIASSLLSPFAVSVPYLTLSLFLLGLGWNLCFIAGSALLAVGLSPAEGVKLQGMGDTWASAASAVGSLSSGFLFAMGAMALVGAVGLGFSLFLVAAWVLSRQKSLALQA